MLEKIFFLIKKEYTLENQVYIGYGIGCFIDGKEMIFENLSADYRKVSNLVEICNDLSLSPVHLCDAVDDFLIDCE